MGCFGQDSVIESSVCLSAIADSDDLKENGRIRRQTGHFLLVGEFYVARPASDPKLT